jgi:hypothetical protein
MREPAAIAHQRDARRATCARREPAAIAHPARRARGDVWAGGALRSLEENSRDILFLLSMGSK